MFHLAPIKDYAFLSSSDGVHQYIIERTGEVWKQPVYCDILFLRRTEPKPAVYNWTTDLSLEDAIWRWRQGYLPILEMADKVNKIELLVSGRALLVRKNEKEVTAFPPCDNPSERFQQEVEKRKKHWDAFFSQCHTPIIPENHSQSAWKSCWVQALSSYRFNHPRYGVGYYAYSVHDGFPPTTIAMTDALWQFGVHKMSLDIMNYFLERFVLDNGAFDYYGPSLAEYGMLLKNLATYASTEEGRTWLRGHKKTIMAMMRLLYRQRNPLVSGDASLQQQHLRLMKGVPEADTRDVEDIYLHNNTWVWRGLTEWTHAANILQWHEMAAEADAEANDLQQCIRREMARLASKDTIAPYILKENLSLGIFTESRDAAYANYRYYPELLECGFLTRPEALAIITAREQRQGELNGMTLMNYRISLPDDYSPDLVPHFGCNNWPIYSYGHALAMLGEKERLDKLIDCHYQYYQSPDIFTAYEGIDADAPTRQAITDWCVPVQLAYPRLLLESTRCRKNP